MNAPSPNFSASAAAAWYCLRVLTRREEVAARNLQQRAGLKVFSPRIPVRRESPSGRTSLGSEALFPGYVFARFRYPHQARHVASMPGVVSLVSFGGNPPAVADQVIERLAAEVGRAGTTPAETQFSEGSWVRIITGCFRGSEGRVLSAGSASSRVCVLLNLLGHEIQISVPGHQLADQAADAGQFPDGLRAAEINSPAAS